MSYNIQKPSMLNLRKKSFQTPFLYFALAISLGLVFSGCAEEGKKKNTNRGENSENKKADAKKNSNLFELEGKVFSIPSPIQTAFLLKKVGTDYQSDLLNPVNNAAEYTTTYEKALALGVFGADLGYATIFDNTPDAISYMAISKKMAGELNISGLFNKETMERFEANLGNQDSLLTLVSEGFKKSDQYLKGNKQQDISVMILAGGWIETLHFATSLANTTKNREIINRIGEQKITLKNLIKLLLPYLDNPGVAEITNQLNELNDLYADINFSYTYKEPTTNEEEKITSINSESNVEMSPAQLEAISAKVDQIRKSIIE